MPRLRMVSCDSPGIGRLRTGRGFSYTYPDGSKVEDEETLLMLKGFGVDCVQGYYLEKPRADHPLLAAASRLQGQNANLELRLT